MEVELSDNEMTNKTVDIVILNENKTSNENIVSNESPIEIELNNAETNTEPGSDSFIKPSFIKPLKKNIFQPLTTINADDPASTTEKSTFTRNDSKESLKLRKGPAQSLAENSVAIPYKEPSSGAILPNKYSFEVIKNGVIFETIILTKSYFVVGRFSSCDVVLEHPSISRFHCVIQQKEAEGDDQPAGIYVFDLGSTHGTYQNRYRLKPKMFNHLRVGHMLKFGGSSRTFILQGPDEDQEPETKETVSELIALAAERKKEILKNELLKKESVQLKEPEKCGNSGVDWGMGDDAVEENSDDAEFDETMKNPFATNEELYLDDPKKSLNGWFEREGYDLPSYDVTEVKPGVFKASVEIPFPSFTGGQPIICTVEHRGKKKDTVIQCALEACRTLDKQGLLRKSTHVSHEKKRKNWTENDYYDSDEDEFLDRTGDIEKKRKLRKKEIESTKSKLVGVETYHTLLHQYMEIIKQLDKLEKKLIHIEELKKKQLSGQDGKLATADEDDLDSFMSNLSSLLPDKHKRVAWKLEVVKLRKEEVRLRKFVNIARPLGKPEIPPRVTDYNCNEEGAKRKENNYGRNILNKDSSRIPKVHEIFLEKEEEYKPKLRKVNCEDDTDNLKPIPYSKPQKMLDKYRGLLTKKGANEDRVSDETYFNLVMNKSKLIAPAESPSALKSCNTVDVVKIGDSSLSDHQHESRVALTKEICKESQVSNSKPELDINTKEAELTSSLSTHKRPEDISKEFTKSKLEFARPAQLSKPKQNIKQVKPKVKSPFDFDKEYEGWVPPAGQTGDGRTSLNQKLGY